MFPREAVSFQIEVTSPTAAAGDKCWPEALVLNVRYFASLCENGRRPALLVGRSPIRGNFSRFASVGVESAFRPPDSGLKG